MIKPEQKNNIIRDFVDEILRVEKIALNEIVKPADGKIVDEIMKRFEEVLSNHED